MIVLPAFPTTKLLSNKSLSYLAPSLFLNLSIIFLFIFSSTTYAARLSVTADFVMSSDWNGQIKINADNITLDCNGYTIHQNGSYINGVWIKNRNNVMVKNCIIEGFSANGVLVRYSSNITVEGSTVSNSNYGFRVRDSNDITLEENSSNENDVGFGVEDTDNVHLIRNSASDNNNEGFRLRDANDSFLQYNTALNNGRDGFDENNGIASYYLWNTAFGNEMNGFELDVQDNSTFWGNDAIANGSNGISLDQVTNCTIRENNLTVNGFGTGNGDGLRIDSGTSNCDIDWNNGSGNADVDAFQCNSCINNVWGGGNIFGTTDL